MMICDSTGPGRESSGLLEHVEELRVAPAGKTAERDRFCEALMAILCAGSLAEAKGIARGAFRGQEAGSRRQEGAGCR